MTRRREFLSSMTCAACGLLVPRALLGEESAPRGAGIPGGSASGGSPAGTGAAKGAAPSPTDPFVREAYFYEKREGADIRCLTCPHECVLSPGESGICRAKRNLGGSHYSISYGNPCTINVDPIEKKPLLHFHPGSNAFSLAVAGCNLRCLNCQNWEISQVSPLETRNYTLPPEAVVEQAKRYECRSIAFTYSEPTSFYEYGVDASSAGRAAGLKSVWVSNGYIARGPLDRLCRSIDGAAVNLKSFEDRIYVDLNGGHLRPVMDTLVRMKENGVWLEVINLVIPTYTDDLKMIRRMCDWHVAALGADTPLHFSRFNPLYKLVHLPPTPVEVLVEARETALAAGLRYVYIGNVPGLAEDTICPGCKKTVVTRRGFRIVSNEVKDGKCGFCREPIAGVWA
jgi:pyruvate formate lyase activating enzyme